MSNPVAVIARESAARLAPGLGRGLRSDVESALLARGEDARPGQFPLDPVSLGSLIVAVATMAWMVYSDLRRDRRRRKRPTAAVMQRVLIMRLKDDDTAGAGAEHLPRIIEVVVSETIKVAGDEELASGRDTHRRADSSEGTQDSRLGDDGD